MIRSVVEVVEIVMFVVICYTVKDIQMVYAQEAFKAVDPASECKERMEQVHLGTLVQ